MKWGVQRGTPVLVKTGTASRLKENLLGMFDFKLTDEQMVRSEALKSDAALLLSVIPALPTCSIVSTASLLFIPVFSSLSVMHLFSNTQAALNALENGKRVSVVLLNLRLCVPLPLSDHASRSFTFTRLAFLTLTFPYSFSSQFVTVVSCGIGLSLPDG